MSERSSDEPLLEVTDLEVSYGGSRVARRSPAVRAVRGVSFSVAPGTTFGLVGESGSGKSSVARALARLVPATGVASLNGVDLLALDRGALRDHRPQFQIVFQDPLASLSPWLTIERSLSEPLCVHTDLDRAGRRRRCEELLDQVGLGPELLDRRPSQISGGQRQRVSIARALALDPALVILDEPVSALDVSSQSQVLNMLRDIQARTGVGYLFISHDLTIVRIVADVIGVMYGGELVEVGPSAQVFDAPRHPYTKALLSARLVAHPGATRNTHTRVRLPGEPIDPSVETTGCRFAARCPHAIEACRSETPSPRSVGRSHLAACLRVDDLEAGPHEVGAAPLDDRSPISQSAPFE